MDYIGIIYVWYCSITGKSYVGLSRSSSVETTRKRISTPEKLFLNRWRGHIQEATYRPQDYFHYAIRKYGHEAFQGTILKTYYAATLEEIKKTVDAAERDMIGSLGTLVPNGYNLQLGGYSPTFHIETRKKMIAKKQAFLRTEEGQEWIRTCSERQLLHFQTEKGLEQRKKHGIKISKLYEARPEIKSNIRNTLMVFFQTDEGKNQIKKLADFLKEFYNTAEGEKMREYQSALAKKRWEDPAYHKNQVDMGLQRFQGEDGERRREGLRDKAIVRNSDPERRLQAAEKTIAHFNKIGRKKYECAICDNKPFRDLTGYTKHCNTKIHQQRANGLSAIDAKCIVQQETSSKISASNKLYAAMHDNSRKGKKHTEEAKEKNRQAHLGRTLSTAAREQLSATIIGQYKSGRRRSGLAKLTDEHVLFIRENKGKITQKILSEKYNVSIQTISSIQNNLTYRHVKLSS
jgi:hypothetical protein